MNQETDEQMRDRLAKEYADKVEENGWGDWAPAIAQAAYHKAWNAARETLARMEKK